MRLALLLLLLTPLACGGGGPTRTQYLLRADVASPPATAAPPRIGLGNVTVASYLAQAGLVVETQTGQVQVASGHQWAEPLPDGLRSYLRAALSKALDEPVSAHRADRSQWDQAVDVHVDQLHGTTQGTARLDATYRIGSRAGSDRPAEHRFAVSRPLPRAGYAALVETQEALLDELAAAMAASLRGASE